MDWDKEESDLIGQFEASVEEFKRAVDTEVTCVRPRGLSHIQLD